MYQDIEWRDGDMVVTRAGQLSLTTGLNVVRQDLLARFVSPLGTHWAYLNEGADLVRYVQGSTDELTLLEFRQEVELEAQKDARVRTAEATLGNLGLNGFDVRVRAQLLDRALLELGLTIGGTPSANP